MTTTATRQTPPSVVSDTGNEYAAATAPARTEPLAVPASNPMFHPALAAGRCDGSTAANASTNVRFCKAP